MVLLNLQIRKFACLAFCLAHLVINGYYFKNDPPFIFTLVKTFTYENLYPGDMIRMFGIKSFLIPILSVFERLYCIELVVFIIYLVGLMGFYAISMKLCRLISGKPHVEFLFASLLLFSKPVLGGVEIFTSYFTYSTIGTPLMLYALYLLFQEKFLRAAVVLGFTFNLHLLSAVPLYIFFILMIVLSRLEKKREALKALFISLVLALPLVIWQLSENSTSDLFFMDPLWLEVIKRRSAHHFFPFFNLYRSDEIIYVVLAILIAMNTKFNSPAMRNVQLIIICSVSLCVVNFFMIHTKPITFIFQMQLYRTAYFLVYFGLMLYVHHFCSMVRFLSNAEKMIAAGMTLSLLLNEIFLFNVILLLWLVFKVVNLCSGKHMDYNDAARIFISIIVISSLITVKHKTFKTFFSDIKVEGKLLCEIDFPWLDSWERYFDPDWADIKSWVKDNMAKDARFIIPPYRKGFRVHAERGIVANWKDGTLGIYDRTFAIEWANRMADLGCFDMNVEYGGWMPPSRCSSIFVSFTSRDFIRLGEKFHAQYLITEKESNLNFEVVYTNNAFRIYRL